MEAYIFTKSSSSSSLVSRKTVEKCWTSICSEKRKASTRRLYASRNGVASPVSISSTRSSDSTKNGASVTFYSLLVVWLFTFLMFVCLFGLFIYLFCVGQFDLENIRKEINKINKEIAKLKIVSVFIFFFIFLMF